MGSHAVKPCPGCQKPIRSSHTFCSVCAVDHRREEGARSRAARFAAQLDEQARTDNARAAPSFEPQAAPPEEWGGRPWNDERNNYRMPNWNAGQPVRNLLEAPLRIAVTDIETTDLWAGMGRTLCANTLFFGPEESITRRADHFAAWRAGKRSDDRELVEAILRDLEKADIIFAYNGTGFDFPFLRTRALIHGLPPVEPRKIVDPVMIARRVFRFRSNRLDAVARAMECPFQKTEVDQGLWARAMLDGDSAAMDQIVEHCEIDVKVLAWVARRIAPYVRQIDQLGSFRGN